VTVLVTPITQSEPGLEALPLPIPAPVDHSLHQFSLCFVCRGIQMLLLETNQPRSLLVVKGSVDSSEPPDCVRGSDCLFVSHQMPQRHHPELSPSLELDAVPALARDQAISGILAMCFLITPQLQNPFPASCKDCELFLALCLVKRMIITPNQSAAKPQATAEGGGNHHEEWNPIIPCH